MTALCWGSPPTVTTEAPDRALIWLEECASRVLGGGLLGLAVVLVLDEEEAVECAELLVDSS